MSNNADFESALELCGFLKGGTQKSHLMNLLGAILRLQENPPIPLSFADIYDQLMKEGQGTKLTKALVKRLLRSLVEVQLVSIENPTSHNKKYIADVNTVISGLEQLKSNRIHELETRKSEVEKILVDITDLECGDLAQQFVKTVTGTERKITSRVVQGVEELHRVIRYNILNVAKKGDTIRVSALWMKPFSDPGIIDRTVRFIEAASRGVDVRYMISTEAFRLPEMTDIYTTERGTQMLHFVDELRKGGVKFDFRIYEGPKTYNQVCLNRDNMALVITEDPVTATWITRDFNPDLIDNAVKDFDKQWKKAKSYFEMTPEDLLEFGVKPEEIASKTVEDRSE